jgi:mRNA interferase RelE/StbE
VPQLRRRPDTLNLSVVAFLAAFFPGRRRLRPRRLHPRDRSLAPPQPVNAEVGYELIVTPPVRRAPSERLPEAAAAAVIDFLTTALVQNPRRVGEPLRGELTGIWTARRGTYRVLYRVRDETREVVVLRIEHRRDICRPH